MKKLKKVQDALDLLMGNFLSIEVDILNNLMPVLKVVVPINWVINSNEEYTIKKEATPIMISSVLTISTNNPEITIDDVIYYFYNDIKKYNEELVKKNQFLENKINLIKKREEEKINKLKEKYYTKINELPIINEVIETPFINQNINSNIELPDLDDNISYQPFDDSMLEERN